MAIPREAAAKKKDWDSYGGLPTTEKAILMAERLLSEWHPLSNGGLGIEISEQGREIWIEIGPTGKVTHASLSADD